MTALLRRLVAWFHRDRDGLSAWASALNELGKR